MGALLMLMTALSLPPGQAGTLQLTNARVTYGMLGPTRVQKTFLPGDIFALHYEIDGLSSKAGAARYTMKMELFDAKGKPKYTSDPEERGIFNLFGGTRVPGFAYLSIGLDTEPGDYVFKITVTDVTAKKSQAIEHPFAVGKRDFGIVGVHLSYPNGPPSPAIGVVGQSLHLNFGIVGFLRDAMKQPNVSLELSIADDAGKSTLAQPIADDIKKVEEKVSVLPGDFPLALTRAGKFEVTLKATDHVSKKTSSVKIPITVQEAPK